MLLCPCRYVASVNRVSSRKAEKQNGWEGDLSVVTFSQFLLASQHHLGDIRLYSFQQTCENAYPKTSLSIHAVRAL